MFRRRPSRLLWLGLAFAGMSEMRVAHAQPAAAPTSAAPLAATPPAAAPPALAPPAAAPPALAPPAATAPATAAPPAETPPAESPAPTLAGFTLLATGGYGASTHSVRGMDLAPFGATFGLDAGFTFPFGLRLGAYGAFSLGRTTDEHRDPIVRRAFDFKADTSSVYAGLALGWDVPLYSLVLRYDLGLGVTSMKWDFGGVDANSVGYGDAKNPNVGFHFVPGALLLWPHGHFVGGVGFDYLVHTNGTIPSAFVGKAVVGVKL